MRGRIQFQGRFEILQNEIFPLKGELARAGGRLTVYMREVHPAFHTTGGYRAALRFLTSPYPKVKDILTDWNKN